MLLCDEGIPRCSVLPIPWMGGTVVMHYNPVLQSQSPETIQLRLNNLVKTENFCECWDVNKCVLPLNIMLIFLEVFSVWCFVLKHLAFGKWNSAFILLLPNWTKCSKLSSSLRSCSWSRKICFTRLFTGCDRRQCDCNLCEGFSRGPPV